MAFRDLLRSIRANWHSPRWWRETAVPFVKSSAYAKASKIDQAWFRLRHTTSWNILAEDWDTLVILDGCRFDLWETAETPWPASRRTSPASHTPGFLRAMFDGKSISDAVYVTANPMIEVPGENLDIEFHDIRHVWDWGWDDNLRTVTPDTMTDAVLDAHEDYPNKRIIAHYMQPHYPFIGPRAQQLSPHTGWEWGRSYAKEGRGEHDLPTVWDQLKHGEVEVEAVWEAYQENLELTIPHLQCLADSIDGKLAITSDHGNMVGDYLWPIPIRGYGHPEGMLSPQLTTVPWIELNSGTRRTVTAENDTKSDKKTNDRDIHQRLKALGYR